MSETELKPCPKCGSKNRLPAPQEAWCADCGAISCTKCGSPRVIDGKTHGWEGPAIHCQICSKRTELVMKPIKAYSKAVWKSESKLRGNAAKKPCPVIGCTKEMSVKNPRGMCAECYGKLREWEVGERTRPAPLWKDEQGRWHRLRRIGRKAA